MELTSPILVIIAFVIAKDIYLLVRVWFFKNPQSSLAEDPFVSVFVAVRNESENIKNCLRALLQQDYPLNKYEIFIGNDDSDDDTLLIAEEIAKSHPNVHVVDIQELVVQAPGKMNVLVQLIEKAEGTVYLFTDGDTVVNSKWLPTMAKQLNSNYGVVTGTTLMRHQNAFERFQYVDWLLAQAMVKVLEDQGLRVTSLGNNMGVSKEAYDAVGGFHGVPFSITEDYELYQTIIGKGFKPLHLYNRDALATSIPMQSIATLLEQRKRWMYGVIRLPFTIIVFLFLNALFVPLIITLFFLSPVAAILIGVLRWIIASIFFSKLQKSFDKKESFLWLIPFEFYQSFINLTTLIYYMIPIKAKWKGRPF